MCAPLSNPIPILDKLGFTHANGNSLDTLTDLAVSHIKKNFERLRDAVEHGQGFVQMEDCLFILFGSDLLCD